MGGARCSAHGVGGCGWRAGVMRNGRGNRAPTDTTVTVGELCGRMGTGGLCSDPRTSVDILIRDMGGDGVGQGVDFMGEVVVFPLHLISEVVKTVVHIVEPRIDIGVHVVHAFVKTLN